MALLTLIYTLLLANTGIALVLIDEPVARIMGALILVFPVFSLWLTARELIFGIQVERLAKRIESLGQWPQLNFELRPSGRPTRESADRVFAEQAERVKQQPNSFEAWFALALAYDAAGDRAQARKAMRKSLALASNQT